MTTNDLARLLASLSDPFTFPAVPPTDQRWGQLLREAGVVGRVLDAGRSSGVLIPLRDVADVAGGVVTRANAYFIVRELSFEETPRRFRLTRSDFSRVAVVMDGTDTPFKIERKYLRPVIKGPDALVSPTRIQETDQRLVHITASIDDLREERSTGALEYIKRGETFPYKVSEDTLKGGVPAQRSNIRNRRPYWYSLSVPAPLEGPRLVVAEHVDRRYPAVLLDDKHSHVVIDKLFILTPRAPEYGDVLLASLNSILTWVQLEFRGRTQLGQGVLELKKTDWSGVLVLNPRAITGPRRASLLKVFAPLSIKVESDALRSSSEPERQIFDEAVFRLCGATDAAVTRLNFERELRAAVSERHERRESVSIMRLERLRTRRAPASTESYAARVAASLPPYPDPRRFVNRDAKTMDIPVTGQVEGKIAVGADLFTHGQVLAGGEKVAEAPSDASALFVAGVLRLDRDLRRITVPNGVDAETVVSNWQAECRRWLQDFDRTLSEQLSSITDPRLRLQIRQRALELLHAEAVDES